jgi:hypothetical protein
MTWLGGLTNWRELFPAAGVDWKARPERSLGSSAAADSLGTTTLVGSSIVR